MVSSDAITDYQYSQQSLIAIGSKDQSMIIIVPNDRSLITIIPNMQLLTRWSIRTNHNLPLSPTTNCL